MRTQNRWLALALPLILSLLFSQQPAVALQDGDSVEPLYFAETGHWVMGDFLKTYQDAPDAGKIYGFPITEAFQDQTIGRVVQYFQRARFELHPENPPELKVIVSPLGAYLYTPGKPLPLPDNFPACRGFPETGFQVCYAFLDFFRENGGAAMLGYPISNFEIHEGRIMQYFQRARLEWRPELPANQRVVLSDLGKIYFDAVRENPVRLLPAPVTDNRPQAILSLQARAFPSEAVLPRSGSQALFVIVQDQNLQPVSGAQITVTILLPSGDRERLVLPRSTDKHGIARFQFTYQNQSPGSVPIQVEVNFDGLKAATATSFRIWW